MYDYQALGWHTLFKSALITVSGDFESCSVEERPMTCLRSVKVNSLVSGSNNVEYGVDADLSGPAPTTIPDAVIIDGVPRTLSSISTNGLHVGAGDDMVVRRDGTDQLHIAIATSDSEQVHIRIGRRFAVVWAPASMAGVSGLCGSPNNSPEDDLKMGSLNLGCKKFERLDSSLKTYAALQFKHEKGVNETADSLDEKYGNSFSFVDKDALLSALEICEEAVPSKQEVGDVIADEERSAAIDNCLFDWDKRDLTTALSNANALSVVALSRLPPADDEEGDDDDEDDDEWKSIAVISLIAALMSMFGLVVLRKRMKSINAENSAEIALLKGQIMKADAHI